MGLSTSTTMHTFILRGNSIFSFMTSVLMGLSAAIALVTPFQLASTPNLSFNVTDLAIKTGRIGYHRDPPPPYMEMAWLTFDMDIDLSSLFHWNTKQLFIFVVAEYETKSHDTNQVTIWDDIITSKEDSMISLRHQTAEYPLMDISGKVTGTKAKLKLFLNVIPHVGFLQTVKTNDVNVVIRRGVSEV